MKVLLTGSTGFLGGKILESLKEQKIEAVLINRKHSGEPNEHQVNLADAESFSEFLKDFNDNVDTVIHCAAVVPWGENPNFELDASMAENLIQLCNKVKPKLLIFLSGWIVYDVAAKVPFKETAVTKPGTDYGMSKLKVEELFRENFESTKLISLRLASIYGPGQTSAGLIPNLTKSALDKGVIEINAKTTKRDYLYIDDLKEAVMNSLKLGADDHEDINVGSGKSISVLEVAESISSSIENIVGSKVTINVKEPVNESDFADNQLDISKAKALGLLKNSTSFSDGINQYVKWAKDADIL